MRRSCSGPGAPTPRRPSPNSPPSPRPSDAADHTLLSSRIPFRSLPPGGPYPGPCRHAPHPAVQAVVDRLGRARAVPTVRAADADAADALARELLAAGFTTFEFTATTPGWEHLVATWTREHPEVAVGLGTVTSTDIARTALAAGAHFLVSPFQVPEVRPVADEADRLFVEGGLTPTELRAAAERGVAKLFPAHVGGIAYLKSLLTVLPGARVMATGGVKVDTAAEWLAAGAFTVSIGGDIKGTRNGCARSSPGEPTDRRAARARHTALQARTAHLPLCSRHGALRSFSGDVRELRPLDDTMAETAAAVPAPPEPGGLLLAEVERRLGRPVPEGGGRRCARCHATASSPGHCGSPTGTAATGPVTGPWSRTTGGPPRTGTHR
ncbi:bifunctional 4-hydroxy-2-oxoglutarate aldolase/2-dehydro-3-deoxy-phosphogluconate aldolase [Streptomyces sp. M19]